MNPKTPCKAPKWLGTLVAAVHVACGAMLMAVADAPVRQEALQGWQEPVTAVRALVGALCVVAGILRLARVAMDRQQRREDGR